MDRVGVAFGVLPKEGEGYRTASMELLAKDN
jgi:hypothetical protein